ncbi:hypothetical protein TruAng_008965 [Truncatella angustata]|nr:hypothetical protein TruAng_008965 [Truncatella angustata]
MTDHVVEPTKSAHSLRPRHRLSRSVTETNTSKLHRHHGHYLLQRRHQDRNSDRNPQSAAPSLEMPPRGSLDLPRSEGMTPYMLSSAEQSRRASMLPSGAEEIGATILQTTTTSREKRIQVQREQAAQRTTGLKKSLSELNAFSLATTRRLDDAYYAVLEKLSMLQSTIYEMKGLATMSQQANESFKSDAQSLVSEIESQLDSVGQFDQQQQDIEELQNRIQTGRQRVQKLSERVDLVRERVERWERADLNWQERTRRRLKVLWVVTSVVALAMVLMFVGTQYASVEVDTIKDKITEAMSSNISGTTFGDELTNLSRISDHLSEDIRAALNETRGSDPAVAKDELLRAFDEL